MIEMSPQVPLAPEDARRSSWMAAAQCGDRVAYEVLLRHCIIPIQRVARLKRVPADRIDDVVQETLLTVHRARHTFDPTRSFSVAAHHRRAPRCRSPAAYRQARGPRAPRVIRVRKPSG